MRRTVRVAAALALVLAAAAPARAQTQPAPLGDWMAGVARHWAAGEADRLVALAPMDERIILDLGGEGPGSVQPRHAAAALRRIFGERQTVTVRASRVTLSGGSPVQGFGELTWVARVRGDSDPHTTIVYIGAVWEDGAWRLRELRLMR
jgi:hypothetical protein